MAGNSIYNQLAEHLSRLGMGFPIRDDLLELLREQFTDQEAEIALALPTGVIPLQPVSVNEIQQKVNLSTEELIQVLDGLVGKGLLFSGPDDTGQKGYALPQVGFGFPQAFFWHGKDTSKSRKMARFTAKYFNRNVTTQAYGAPTKPYRYVPIGSSLASETQAVYPLHMMRVVIDKAEKIALAHCPCRVSYKQLGKACPHPDEVCMKFDEMAQYVIDQGLGREINQEEALEVIHKSEEAGLVHFVDNSEGGIKHNCNCCGCACWNVGNIRRRKIPRDDLMATYFMRSTDHKECTGCGACEDICPIAAVQMVGDQSEVDEEWCIGCGVCSTVCPSDCIRMKLRTDRTGELPEEDWTKLHERILMEKEEARDK